MAENKNLSFRPAAGFYVTILAALTCLASAAFYSMYFRGKVYTHGPLYNDLIFYGLIASAVVGLVMLFFRMDGFAPVILCIASGLSLLVYIYHMVWPIADVFIAIDPVTFIPQMVICGALLLSSFILAETALYLKKRRMTA